MSDRPSSPWLAALTLTRSNTFRAALGLLMMVSLFDSRPSARFPNCDCETLDYLCTSVPNPASCDEWEAWCNVDGYCDCMAVHLDQQWCSQFCPAQACYCSGVSCADHVVVDGGLTELGSDIWLTAHAYDQDGDDRSDEGTWSWWVSDSSVGYFTNASTSTPTFHPTGAGTTDVFATFSMDGCGSPLTEQASVTVSCPFMSLSLDGPAEVLVDTSTQYAIQGCPGTIPLDQIWCSGSNPNAGEVFRSGNYCMFTSTQAGQSNLITVTVDPGSGCQWNSASKWVSVVEWDPCPCWTPLTDSEWQSVQPDFPNLIREHVCREAAATDAYNCIAWAAGIDYVPVWPDYDGDDRVTRTEMDSFFDNDPRVTIRTNIAIYGFSEDNLKHAARKAGGPGLICAASSKLGRNIRISHSLAELAGGPLYGTVQYSR